MYVTISIDTNDKFTVCVIESIQDLNFILRIQTKLHGFKIQGYQKNVNYQKPYFTTQSNLSIRSYKNFSIVLF